MSGSVDVLSVVAAGGGRLPALFLSAMALRWFRSVDAGTNLDMEHDPFEFPREWLRTTRCRPAGGATLCSHVEGAERRLATGSRSQFSPPHSSLRGDGPRRHADQIIANRAPATGRKNRGPARRAVSQAEDSVSCSLRFRKSRRFRIDSRCDRHSCGRARVVSDHGTRGGPGLLQHDGQRHHGRRLHLRAQQGLYDAPETADQGRGNAPESKDNPLGQPNGVVACRHVECPIRSTVAILAHSGQPYGSRGRWGRRGYTREPAGKLGPSSPT